MVSSEPCIEFDEQQLIAHILAGDRDRYREIVLRHQERIFSLCLRQVGNRAIAEELSQEIFLKAFLNLKSFRAESSFLTWLTRIALNTTNTFFTSRRYKEMSREESIEKSYQQGQATSPETELARSRMLAEFRMAIHGLSPKLRDSLVLVGLEGKSYEEAAEILKIPVGSVKSRLHLARNAVRRVMGDHQHIVETLL